MWGRLSIKRVLSSPELICSSNMIPIKIPRGSCSCTRQGDYKYIKNINKQRKKGKKNKGNEQGPTL